jgi:hypothetical protein
MVNNTYTKCKVIKTSFPNGHKCKEAVDQITKWLNEEGYLLKDQLTKSHVGITLGYKLIEKALRLPIKYLKRIFYYKNKTFKLVQFFYLLKSSK